MKKREYLYNQLLKVGATPSEATKLLDLDEKFNLSSLKRKWRAQAEESEKNRAKEKEYKIQFTKDKMFANGAFVKGYSKSNIYETAKRLRQEKDPNLQLL